MATVPKLLTYEDWLRMPPVEDGTDEVVKGEYRFMPPTKFPHAFVVRRLNRRFEQQVDEDRIAVLGSNFGLMISRDPLTCRSPDLALCWVATMVIEDGNCVSAPELVIEVLSPSEHRRRQEEKMEDYASIGVPEAWLCSPEAQSVEVRKLVEGRLVIDRIVVEGTLEPVRFPGVKIQVGEIWPE